MLLGEHADLEDKGSARSPSLHQVLGSCKLGKCLVYHCVVVGVYFSAHFHSSE